MYCLAVTVTQYVYGCVHFFSQAPGLVALNPRKKLYSTFVGSFSSADLSNFINNVLSGQEGLQSIKVSPCVLITDNIDVCW